MKANAPLAKLDIASVYGTEGQRFESPTARHKTQYIVVFIEKCFAIYCVLFFVFGVFRERNFKNKPLCLLLHTFKCKVRINSCRQVLQAARRPYFYNFITDAAFFRLCRKCMP